MCLIWTFNVVQIVSFLMVSCGGGGGGGGGGLTLCCAGLTLYHSIPTFNNPDEGEKKAFEGIVGGRKCW